MRNSLIAGSVIIAVIGVGIAILLAVSGGSAKTGSTTADASLAKIDGQDPNQAGCAPTGVSLRETRVSVIAPDGSRGAALVLRRSTACQAIWGRVDGLRGHSDYLVEIDVHRPSDNAVAQFHTADSSPEVFGNMLSEHPGCVYATAYLQHGARRGPLAKTPCR